MHPRLVQAIIFLAGITLGGLGYWGLWHRVRGPDDRSGPSAPVFETKSRVARQFHAAIVDFCEHDHTRETLFQYYAPGGAIRMGAGQVPSPAKASFTETEMLISLVTTDAATRVVWWMKPKTGDLVDEIHVVPDAGARIVAYEDFVKKFALGPGKKLPQSASLSDVPHVHQVECGDRELTATLQEIVWTGDFIGKMGEMTLTKGDASESRARQVEP
jgi:hypothetical protein